VKFMNYSAKSNKTIYEKISIANINKRYYFYCIDLYNLLGILLINYYIRWINLRV